MGHDRERPQRRNRNRSATALNVIIIGMLVVLWLAIMIGVLSHA
jgi:hypothetical protein